MAATVTKEIAIAPGMHTGGRVAAIVPTTWNEVVTIAASICRAGMAPKSYLDKQNNPMPDKVAVAIMHGLEVGFTPMAALQSIAVINGMPSVYGDGLLALIRASGLLEDCQEEVEWGKDGPLSATCKMWRKGEKSPSIQTYTRADAQNARLWGKQGPWTDHPARMLQWRARGWCGRDKFADVLRGLRSAEEVEDMVDVTPQGAATTAPPEPKRSDYTEQPSPPADSPPGGGKDGQPATSPPDGAGGDSKPEATSKPAPITDTVDMNDKETDDSDLWPERPKEGEKLEFARFSKVVDFCEFAEIFLPRTNKLGAEQFAEWYDGTLVAMERGKKGSQDAAAEIRTQLKKLIQIEPGAEG